MLDSPHAVECELVEDGGTFVAHRPTNANLPAASPSSTAPYAPAPPRPARHRLPEDAPPPHARPRAMGQGAGADGRETVGPLRDGGRALRLPPARRRPWALGGFPGRASPALRCCQASAAMPRSRRLTKPRGGCRASRRRCTGTRGPPVNPTPIAGLERHLHRRQGDARLALRAVRKAVLERNREGRSMISTTTERTRGPTRRPDAIWTSASAIQNQTAATIGAACDATDPPALPRHRIDALDAPARCEACRSRSRIGPAPHCRFISIFPPFVSAISLPFGYNCGG